MIKRPEKEKDLFLCMTEKKKVLSLCMTGWIAVQFLFSLKETARSLTAIRTKDEYYQERVSPKATTQDYSWIGNHWIPAAGVSTYDAKEMATLFRRHNTLWLGDSTCRQDFATLFNIINWKQKKNTTTSSSSSDMVHISQSALDLNINVNKGKVTEICTQRDFSNTSLRGQTWSSPGRFICWQVPGSNEGLGKFDMAGSACPSGVTDLVDLERNGTWKSMLKEYDILVVELGIWEIARNWDCRRKNQSETSQERMTKSLERLQMIASPNLAVFWKTFGTDDNKVGNNEKTRLLNEHVRQWFEKESPGHMHLVDWGKQILPRSLDSDRIKGDMKPHWGIEARTLNAQMLTRAITTNLG